jgi:hypothetical protein
MEASAGHRAARRCGTVRLYLRGEHPRRPQRLPCGPQWPLGSARLVRKHVCEHGSEAVWHGKRWRRRCRGRCGLPHRRADLRREGKASCRGADGLHQHPARKGVSTDADIERSEARVCPGWNGEPNPKPKTRRPALANHQYHTTLHLPPSTSILEPSTLNTQPSTPELSQVSGGRTALHLEVQFEGGRWREGEQEDFHAVVVHLKQDEQLLNVAQVL